MSNSPLVNYTKYSPNHYGKRNHVADRITPHCVVGQCSIETLGNRFAQRSVQASSNYGIGVDGRIGLFVDEQNAAWTSGGKDEHGKQIFCNGVSGTMNDHRAITIECASDVEAPNAFKPIVYDRLIELSTDICKRYGKTKLLWIPDKNQSVVYNPKADEMVLSVHRWFARKACPGDWMYARMGDLANKVTAKLWGSPVPVPSPAPTPQPEENLINVHYKVYAGKWYPEVTNYNTTNGNGYAGVENKAVSGVMAKVPRGVLRTRVKVKGRSNYLPWVTGYNSNDGNNGFAGILGKPIDRVQFDLQGAPGYAVEYRVSVVGQTGYLPWVRGTSDYAGIDGKAIDKLQIRIVKG